MAATLPDVIPLTIFTFIYNFIYNFFFYRENQMEYKFGNSKFHRVHLNPSTITPDEIYPDRSKHWDLLPPRRANMQHKVPFGISFPRISWDTVIRRMSIKFVYNRPDSRNVASRGSFDVA